MSASWKPDAEQAQFIGSILAIDTDLALHVADLLRKGNSLRSVRRTLEDALHIAALARSQEQVS